ncbi:hypothetical protein [Dactylosporangium sp. NPDC051484]|uniref:hypothetical protein n=1 Tax=Dactylosporangium sp. NPDC051484 TaxID=3154942 RepID=UPI00344D88ED
MNDNPFQILVDEPVPATRLDAGRVLHAGRTRVRRRRAVTTVAAAVAVLVVVAGGTALAVSRDDRRPKPAPAMPGPSPSTGPVTCTGAEVTGADGASSIAMDPTGQWIAVGDQTGQTITLLKDGTAVRTVTQPSVIVATAVSAAGTVVGYQDLEQRQRPISWRDGHVTTLPLPTGAVSGQAGGVNVGGDIVGVVNLAGNQRRAVLWRFSDPLRPVLLDTPSGKASTAARISDDGRITGAIGGYEQPYLWSAADGHGRPLPVPDGMPGGVAVYITGEWVVGTIDFLARSRTLSDGTLVGTEKMAIARWNLRDGTVERIPGEYVSATGVTRDGRVVLFSMMAGVQLWDGTRVGPLPGTSRVQQPEGLSDDGSVLLIRTDRGLLRYTCKGG